MKNKKSKSNSYVKSYIDYNYYIIGRVIDIKKRKILIKEYKDFFFHPEVKFNKRTPLAHIPICEKCRSEYAEYIHFRNQGAYIWGDAYCKKCSNYIKEILIKDNITEVFIR